MTALNTVIKNIDILKKKATNLHKYIFNDFAKYYNIINNYNYLLYIIDDHKASINLIYNNFNKIKCQVLYDIINCKFIIYFMFYDIKKLKRVNIEEYNITNFNLCINKFKSFYFKCIKLNWPDKKLNNKKIILLELIDDYDKNNIHDLSKIITLYNNKIIHNDNFKVNTDNIVLKNIDDMLKILNKIKQIYIKLDFKLKDIMVLTEEFMVKIPFFCKNKIKALTYNECDYLINNILISYPNEHIFKNNISFNDINSYNNIKTNLIFKLDCDDDNYKTINNYFYNNFYISNDVIIESIYKYKSTNTFKYDNALLLFHGTELKNIYNILNVGLKIPIKNKHYNKINGLFGNGIYFTNCSSKSYNYCVNNLYGNYGVVLVCSVNLKRLLIKNNIKEYNKQQLNNMGYDSIKANGKYTPNVNDFKCIGNYTIPIGNKTENKNFIPSLNYDEYICYNENDIIIEYLILTVNNDII